MINCWWSPNTFSGGCTWGYPRLCSTCTAWRWAPLQWRGRRTWATPCSSWIGHAPGHGLGRSPNQTFFRKGCIHFAHIRYRPHVFFRLGRFCFPKGIRRPAGKWFIKLCRVLPLPISDNLQSTLDFSPSHLNSNMSSCLIHGRPCKYFFFYILSHWAYQFK